MRADLRTALGWTTTADELAKEKPITDRWQSLASESKKKISCGSNGRGSCP